MANMSASVQMIVSTCVPPGTTPSQVQGVAATWIRSFVSAAARAVAQQDEEAGNELQQLNESRLSRLLQAGSLELRQPKSAGYTGVAMCAGSIEIPRYWLNQQLKLGEQIKVRTEDRDSSFFKHLTFSATHACCSGRDGAFEIGTIKKVKSYRIENPIIWKQYQHKATELAARHRLAGVEVCPALRPPVPTV